MDLLLIYLFAVVGRVFGGQEHKEIGNEVLKVNEDDNKAALPAPFHDDTLTVNPGQNLLGVKHSKHDFSGPTLARSNETEMGIVESLYQTVDESKGQNAISETPKGHRRHTRSIFTVNTLLESTSIVTFFLNKLPDLLRDKMLVTEEAEGKLLEYYAKPEGAPSEVLAAYNSAKNDERQVLKRLLADAESYAPRILENYKRIRRGKVWIYIKNNGKFQAALKEYENLKKDESESLDRFLTEPKKSIAMRQKEIEEAEELYRMARAKAEEIVQKEEKTEEVDDKFRGQTIEARRTGKEAANREKTGDNVAPAENVKTTNDISKSTDDVRSADSMRLKNTANERTGESANSAGIATLLSVTMIAALAILVLGFYKKDIMVWYRRKKMAKLISTSADGERIPLNPRKKRTGA